ncbi:tyrosine-type recombinase/integrase [Pseudomonas viridiflava]|uniref:tyrosine-type recombinase/integrase n=1 Tax=Pseudomonas viridiflava TaxID=33069 RepID=UPI000F017CFE|nr:integrase arm-type DNA-binding domain-containing protein [Pseudomonas viridiflava]
MSLSQKVIEKITQPGVYQDKYGLLLKVRPSGSKSWIWRYQFNGQRHDAGLGSFPTVGLADARRQAMEFRVVLGKGINPLAQRMEAAKISVTVEDEVLTFIERHKAGWSEKHAKQWLNSMTDHVFPVIGRMPVADVETHHIMSVLDPIWTEKPETARRVRNRLEKLLSFAQSQGHCPDEKNPAAWRGHLEHIMPKNLTSQVPLESMPYSRLPYFMRVLEGETSRAARCLQFLILTACRSNEAMAAKWQEIDLINRVWTIPGDRMKNGDVHQIPLSDEAVQVLKDTGTRGKTELIFPNAKMDKVLADNSLRRLLLKLGEDCTPHGFRSTFSAWIDERTSFSSELREISLSHVIGTATSRAYSRGNQLEKRRPMMARWAQYAMERVSPQVVTMANRRPSAANQPTA